MYKYSIVSTSSPILLFSVFFSYDNHPSVCEVVSDFTFFFFGRAMRAACGILFPPPGIEPMPPAVEALSANHWTTKEVPHFTFNLHFLND